MTMIPGWLDIDQKCAVSAFQATLEKLDGTDGEAVLDFSSVRRLDSSALRAMEEFVAVADQKGVKVVLSGVSVSVYKVLKLAKLASRFSFKNREPTGCL